MSKLIFLSHIHEERDLAILIKNALEDEFGGFVEVFVSSDGISIPAGANFLKRIEDGLATCAAALYLISPKSVTRQWINFELGAVWIRNVISVNAGNEPIPAIPICHSGTRPATLPAPLNYLNGIVAGDAAQLEFAFRSIQVAMGGKGRLKTDFNKLISDIAEIERRYSVARNLREVLSLLPDPKKNIPGIVAAVSAPGFPDTITLSKVWIETNNYQRIKHLASNELSGIIFPKALSSGTRVTSDGATNGVEIDMEIIAWIIRESQNELLK